MISKTSIDLVIAKYKEDTSWSDKFSPFCRIIIYDKGKQGVQGSLPNIPSFPWQSFKGSFHAKTPTGRESHTYLYHILKNYPHFSDFLFFCQGRIDDHVPLFGDCCDYLIKTRSPPHFLHLGKPDFSDITGARIHRGLPIERVYRRLFKNEPPENFTFQLNSTFWVSQEAILSRPKRFYEEMMQIVYDEPLSGYIFERLWGFVFNSPELEHQNWDYLPKKELWNLDL